MSASATARSAGGVGGAGGLDKAGDAGGRPAGGLGEAGDAGGLGEAGPCGGALAGLDAIRAALAGFQHAPLSRKRAMLLALLIDAEVDRRAMGDLLAHRRAIAAQERALAAAMEVATMRDAGPRLVTETVPADGDNPQALSEADYMVSLYNAATVQRVRIAWPDGSRADAAETLRRAVAALECDGLGASAGPAG